MGWLRGEKGDGQWRVMEVESGEGNEGSRGVRRGVRKNEGRAKA